VRSISTGCYCVLSELVEFTTFGVILIDKDSIKYTTFKNDRSEVTTILV